MTSIWPSTLLADYKAAQGQFDEVVDAKSQPRDAWLRFGTAAGTLTRAEFGRRWDQARRLLQQNSLAYPDPRDPRARKYPWELDAIPLVIDGNEWREVSAALEQRAHLLNAILVDLWGPQRLLRDHLLPADLVLRHPGFALPLTGAEKPHRERWLDFYAADLARAPDGSWWVLNDRTEAPSGAGYALQNRLAISRMLPDVIRKCRVERLAPYFVALQNHISTLADKAPSDSRVVLLTQPAGSPNFFEDAFLARYLGYTLADSDDLTMRSGRVFLKTLGGLAPVDAIMRRPDSLHCDPLELDPSGAVGIGGLVQSARQNNVVIANRLGSGLVESPAFMAFLPSLCKHILGEQLKIPGVATWWCGTDEGREMVLSRLDKLVIKPAYRRRGSMSVETRRLGELDQSQLADRIKAEPWKYVGQEKVVRSTAPTWNNGNVESAYIALRTFATADGDDYHVMQGGLTRVASSLEPLELALLDGERSKDTWVLSEGDVGSVSLLPADDEPIELRRTGADLPSRVAENLYWIGRLTERAEALARLLRTVSHRIAGDEDASKLSEMPMLLRVLAEHGQIEPGFVLADLRRQLPAIEETLPSVVFDDLQPGALRATVSQIIGLASKVRDRLSLDTWRVLKQLDDEFWPAGDTSDIGQLQERVGELLVTLAAFAGLVSESMTRTPTWRFLDLGRRLERAMQTTTLLSSIAAAHRPPTHAMLEAALEVADSLMTYRSRYFTRLHLAPVVDLLLTDDSNPRSIAYGIAACRQYVRQLNDDTPELTGDIEQEAIDRLAAMIRGCDAVEVSRRYLAGNHDELGKVLDTLDGGLPDFSNVISHKYFAHAGPLHRMTEMESS